MVPQLCFQKHPRAAGFTLAELLIALAILGVIATFVIPKVLNSQQDNKKISVFKEIISTVASVLDQGIQNGGIKDPNSFGMYAITHLNAVKICPTDAQAQGCWTQADGGTTERNEAGAVLHNGATLSGIANFPLPGQVYDYILIDWNGTASPNVFGDDQLWLKVCWGYDATECPAGGNRLKGVDATNQTLYETVFK